jgi:hypothetical protein
MVLPGARQESLRLTAEKALDQGTHSVLFGWETFSHLKPHSGGSATGTAFSGNDAIGLEFLAAKGMVAFGTKFGVGQHTAYGPMPMRLGDQQRQSSAIVPGSLTSVLGQDQLPLHIDHGQPLQPMFPGALRLTKMLHPADEVAAHRALRQARTIYGYRDGTSPPPRHAPHNLVHQLRHIGRIEPPQKARQRGVVGDRSQIAQLGMFPQRDLDFAEGPVLVAQQAKHCQQLRLCKLPLVELRPLSRQYRLADLRGQPCKTDQSNLGHLHCAKAPEQLQINRGSALFRTGVPRMSTEPACFIKGFGLKSGNYA